MPPPILPVFLHIPPLVPFNLMDPCGGIVHLPSSVSLERTRLTPLPIPPLFLVLTLPISLSLPLHLSIAGGLLQADQHSTSSVDTGQAPEAMPVRRQGSCDAQGGHQLYALLLPFLLLPFLLPLFLLRSPKEMGCVCRIMRKMARGHNPKHPQNTFLPFIIHQGTGSNVPASDNRLVSSRLVAFQGRTG